MPIGAMRFRYSTQVSMFSSIDSSDRSSMCELKRGRPNASKWRSPSSMRPEIHPRFFFGQWSVCRMTRAS